MGRVTRIRVSCLRELRCYTQRMRALLIALAVAAACLAVGCATEDTSDLSGSPIAAGHSKKAKATDDDDDDDDMVTVKKKKHTTATASSPASASSAPATAETLEARCVEMISQYRLNTGLPALARWTQEESCSDC